LFCSVARVNCKIWIVKNRSQRPTEKNNDLIWVVSSEMLLAPREEFFFEARSNGDRYIQGSKRQQSNTVRVDTHGTQLTGKSIGFDSTERLATIQSDRGEPFVNVRTDTWTHHTCSTRAADAISRTRLTGFGIGVKLIHKLLKVM
jgi:hypothetical protein